MFNKSKPKKFWLVTTVHGKAAGGGGGSTSITVTDAVASNGSFASIGTFNMAVGSYSAATDDLIFFVGDDQGGNIGTPSLGGVTATLVEKNADTKTAVFVVPRGSGVTVTTGNVSVTPGGAGWGSYALAVGYAHGNASGTPTAHATTAFTFFASPMTLSGVVASGGAGVAFWWNEGGTGTPVTWLPAGWAKVAASEKTNATGNGSSTSSAVQGTPAAGTYTIDPQKTGGALAFIAFA